MSAIVAPPLHELSVEDYHRLGEAGVLAADSRVELIDGALVGMAPIGSVHASVVSQLTTDFARSLGDRAIVWTQNPVQLGPRSEPQPDILLLRPRPDAYRTGLPTAPDVLLLIEVSDASLHYDRSVKLPLYARHGVREVWVIDLVGRALGIHRRPELGAYMVEWACTAADRVSPEALRDIEVDLAPILGPSP